MSRWIRVSTSIFGHELFTQEPFTEREAWLWLIANAAWKQTHHRIGSTVVDVPTGSLFTTLRELQRVWKWRSDTRVRSFLNMLIDQRMVGVNSDAGKTQISICNYDKYQNAERTENVTETQPERKDNALKTPIHQDTNNTSSLRSEETAQAPRKRAHRMPDDFEPDLEFAMSEGLTLSEAKAEVAKMRDWSKSSKNGAKLDWPATWRGWVRRAVADRSRPRQQAPPRQTAFQERHQSAIDAFDKKLGVSPDDQFTGSTIDLGNGDWRPH